MKKAAYYIMLTFLIGFIIMCLFLMALIDDNGIKLGFGGLALASLSLWLFIIQDSRNSKANTQLLNDMKTELDSINNKLGHIKGNFK